MGALIWGLRVLVLNCPQLPPAVIILQRKFRLQGPKGHTCAQLQTIVHELLRVALSPRLRAPVWTFPPMIQESRHLRSCPMLLDIIAATVPSFLQLGVHWVRLLHACVGGYQALASGVLIPVLTGHLWPKHWDLSPSPSRRFPEGGKEKHKSAESIHHVRQSFSAKKSKIDGRNYHITCMM